MKNSLLALMVVGAFLFSSQADAQVRVHVNLNIGRPAWGIQGNDEGDYYYMPEIDTYYDIPHRQFIYLDGGNWAYDSELPYIYRDYDLYHGYKVIINEPRPFLHADIYRQRYNRYYNTYRPRVGYGYGNYGGRDDRYYDNGRFNSGRPNQHFDNKRNENEHNQRFDNRGYRNRHDNDDDDDERGNGNGRWKSERGRD